MGLRTVTILVAICALGLALEKSQLLGKGIDQKIAKLRHFRDSVLAAHSGDLTNRPQAPIFVPKKPTLPESTNNGNACAPGYTGSMCLSPICYNTSYIVTHDGLFDGIGDTIEKDVSMRCRDRFSFPLDISTGDVFVTVDSVAGGRPYGRLYDPKGTEIQPCAEVVLTENQIVSQFCKVVATSGAGLYTIALDSQEEVPCAFEVTSPTFLYPDGGFVTDPRDDQVQTFIPDENEAIGRYPMEGSTTYLAFHMTHDVFPVAPQVVSIYTNGYWDQNYDLLTRYGCFSPHITKSNFTCTRNSYYHTKFIGVDEQGNTWQRVYDFDCDIPGTVQPYPTGTAPTQSECYNTGILTVNKTCYCGDFYEGPQCELKRCYNGGELDFQNDVCLCKSGYSGPNCENVYCARPISEPTDLSQRALGFVIRSSQSMQAQMDQIVAAAVNVTATFSSYHPGYFQAFILSIVQNNGVLFTREFGSYNDFISAIRSMTHPPTDTECDDALFLGISEVLQSPSMQLFPKSPIFIFSDGVANDAVDVRYNLLNQLSFYRGELYFMLSDSVTGRCNVQVNDPGYESMRGVAAFSQGQVVKTDVNNIANAVSHLAEAIWMMDTLVSNDLEDCRKAPKYNTFFVDESVSYLIITATGANLTTLVTSPNRTVFKPMLWYSTGNLYIWAIDTPVIGNYLVSLNSMNTGASVCQYRVTGRSNYDLFVGVTQSLDSDEVAKQPTWREPGHLVAHINNVWTPNLFDLKAEAFVITNDVGGQRQVAYASSGIYRDRCQHFLYFGAFTCRVPNMMFYVQVYMTDSAGNTILRTTTGFCSAAMPTAIPSDGCANGGVSYNGTCICPHHFSGPKCQQIVCENLGTPLLGACQCPAGYSGQFCQITACNTYNQFTRFDQHHKSLSVLIHDSISTRSVFRTLNGTVSRVMEDIRYTHPQWIEAFQLVRFNDKEFTAAVDSQDANDFIKGVNTLAQYNYDHSDYSCKDLNLFPALYATLSSMDISFGGIVYVFINGLVKSDTATLAKIFNHLESTKTVIHVIQTSTAPCGQDLYSAQSTVLMGLAEFTGGRYTLTMANKAGDVFKSLPTLYNSQLMTENYVVDCSKPTTFYVPVDGYTQSFDVAVSGDLTADPIYISPDGNTYNVVNLWNDVGYGSRGDQIIQPCDQGWDQFDNRCFKFGLMDMSWSDAAATCHYEGASLATIFNQADQDFLNYQSGGAVDYWTGLNDITKLGTFMWDNAFNFSLSLDATSYTNWGNGQPVETAQQRCVFDQQKSAKGWATASCNATKSYVCQKHVYNQWFEPRDPKTDMLPRGIWKVKVQADGVCSVAVTAQSSLQVHTEYSVDVHSDFGYSEPFQGTDNNRILAHVSGIINEGSHTVEYAHFYQDNLTIIQAQTMTQRSNCLFQYISSPFQCPTPSFQMMISGVDDYGYLYQRVIPVTCLGGPSPSDCENGGVYYKGQCVCGPNYYGEFCEVAECFNGGRISGNLGKCMCPDGFSGNFCEVPVCTRHGNKPDISEDHRTFVLALDATSGGLMGNVLQNLQTTLGKVINGTNNIYSDWFGSYVGVVFRDADAANHALAPVGDVITKSDPNEFIKAMVAEANKAPRIAPTGGRQIFTALTKALTVPQVKTRSTAFVVTTGYAEDIADEDLLMDAMAQTHTSINLFIVGDTTPPGNGSYRQPEVESLFGAMHISGGAVYQTHDDTTLASDWSQVALTLHRTYYVVSNFRRDCSNYDEFVQMGANSSAIVIDVFNQTPPKITVTDPSGKNVKSTTAMSSRTNTLDDFVTIGDLPGIYTLGMDDGMSNSGGCMVNVRGLSNLDVHLGFTQDVESDGGLHSGDAYLFPQAGFEQNAIVAATTGATLTYVQLFDTEERRLHFASPFIARKNCFFPYISQSVFRCDRHSFVVAIDGLDFEGHPFRRMYTIHCIGFIPTRPPRPTGTREPFTGTFPMPTTTKPLPSYPTCDNSVPLVDLIVAFDSSLTMPKADYTMILDKFYDLTSAVKLGQNNTRVLMGTYDNAVHFENQDFLNINGVSDYLVRLLEVMWQGYTGNDGNNVQGVLDYLTKSEQPRTPFRTDKNVRKIIILFSSVGWDQGNYYDGKDHGFGDPSADAKALQALGVEFYPVGFGDKANLGQLQALSSKCARVASNAWELQDAMNYFFSILCSTKPTC